MELELKGKRAIITGASKGIGFAVAKTLVGEGCSVHLVARSADKLSNAVEELSALGAGSVSCSALDLSDSKNIEILLSDFSETDILINNAGAIPGGDLQTIDEERWRSAWDLKVFGYINLSLSLIHI